MHSLNIVEVPGTSALGRCIDPTNIDFIISD